MMYRITSYVLRPVWAVDSSAFKAGFHRGQIIRLPVGEPTFGIPNGEAALMNYENDNMLGSYLVANYPRIVLVGEFTLVIGQTAPTKIPFVTRVGSPTYDSWDEHPSRVSLWVSSGFH